MILPVRLLSFLGIEQWFLTYVAMDGCSREQMYRGGKICLTVHFKPLWAKNCPRFGIAHALCLGLAPWLAAEVPILVDSGMVKHKDDEAAPAEASASAAPSS
jgi:ufm1-conjugating enzyme 1